MWLQDSHLAYKPLKVTHDALVGLISACKQSKSESYHDNSGTGKDLLKTHGTSDALISARAKPENEAKIRRSNSSWLPSAANKARCGT